jgi:hypothetical protein
MMHFVCIGCQLALQFCEDARLFYQLNWPRRLCRVHVHQNNQDQFEQRKLGVHSIDSLTLFMIATLTKATGLEYSGADDFNQRKAPFVYSAIH